MRILHPVAEDEVVATFLRAEIDSGRYGEKLRRLLIRDEVEPDVLRHPNLADAAENRYRQRLLDEHRAYERRQGMFGGFPRAVEWFRASLSRDEVLDVLYIDWDYWLELSGGTRRPRDAARRIRAGEVSGAAVAEHKPVADALRTGTPPELIAVTTSAHAPIVVIEGHFRLTAYALFPECLPEELEIIVGVADELAAWPSF